jgi:hypothetical protein
LSFIKNYKIQPRQKTQICQHSFEGNFRSVPTIPYLLKLHGDNSIKNIYIPGFQKIIPITQIPSTGFCGFFLFVGGDAVDGIGKKVRPRLT